MKTVGDGNSYKWNSWSGDHYKADYEYSEHFWNSLTKPEPNVATYHQGTHHDEEVIMDMIVHSDFEGINGHQETDLENGINKYNFEDLASDEENELQVEDSHIEYCYYNTDQLPQTMTTTQCASQGHGETDYSNFIKATEEGNWERMKDLLEKQPEAVGQKIFHKRKRTALHHAIYRGKGWEEIAKCLVNRMTEADLEMKDEDGHTSLALAALCHSSKELLECIVERNPQLPYKGTLYTIPVIVASYKGFTDTTHYLYSVTHQSFLGPQHHDGQVGLQLLIQCINIKLFDIATELVKNFEGILYQKPPLHVLAEAAAANAANAAAEGAADAEAKAKAADKAAANAAGEAYPIHAFAITFSALLVGIEHTKSVGGNFSTFGDCIMTCGRSLLDESRERKAYKADKDKESGHIDEARAFLRLVCDEVSKFDIRKLSIAAYKAMIEAATHGNIEFVSEMLKANPDLLSATNGNETMITRAIMYRHEEVFNIVYGAPDYKDELFTVNSTEGGNNILHCAAKLPLPSVLDRISSGGPALQMQREIQWFQAVRGEAKDRYREDINYDGKTPGELFIKEHKELCEAGEKSMKKTALAATTVAALIVTTMFGAALAVISGVNQRPSFQTLQTKPLFNTFIVFDALSLFSSTCSILVFLGILASRYSQQDFLRSLPRMFMVGFYTLFCSIVTMMAAFGIALLIMLDHGLHSVIVAFPVLFFFVSLCPVLCRIRRSTYGPSIFGKTTQVSTTRLKHVDSCF